MSLHEPIGVGSTPYEPPETIWEVAIEATFNPHLTAEEIGTIQDRISGRLEELVREAMRVEVDTAQILITALEPLYGRGETSPLFPMIAGESRFTCNLDVLELIDRQCEDSDLQEIAYDARGRAYALSVAVDYCPRPELDGQRWAAMPDPEEVRRMAAQRAGGAIFETSLRSRPLN